MKRFSIFLSLIAVVFITPPYLTAYGDNSMVSMRIQSPGIQVGVTDYDWHNGSLGRRIYATPNGGFHFIWMNGSQLNYRVYYNYYYPPSYWLGLTQLDTRVCKLGGLALMSDGRAVVVMYVSVGPNIIPVCYIDAAEGAGSFTIIDIPVPDPSDAPCWPKVGIDDLDYIYVSGSGTAQGAWWTMSIDQGATWADWNNSLGGVVLTDSFFDSGGRETWTTYNSKVALINNSGLNLSYHYWESTDHGQTWTFDTVFTPEPDDSVQGYIWHSAVYDNAGDLHVVFCCIDTTTGGGGGGGASGSGWRSQIRHWDSGTDQVSLVASGWWATNPGPGAIHPTVSECQVAIDRVSGGLYCTWCQADTGADTSAYGYTNLEIYGARSIDNGATWINHHNITNSHTPGAAPGDCDHDWWQSIAETTHGDTLAIFYMNDKDAGSFVMGEGGAFTDNPMLFYYYPFVGIEEHDANTPMRLTFNIAPNPVVHRLNISYALPSVGNISIRFYSVDGRLVKTIEDSYKPAGMYTLNLNISDLASGTYFVVLNTPENTISCPVIVVH